MADNFSDLNLSLLKKSDTLEGKISKVVTDTSKNSHLLSDIQQGVQSMEINVISSLRSQQLHLAERMKQGQSRNEADMQDIVRQCLVLWPEICANRIARNNFCAN